MTLSNQETEAVTGAEGQNIPVKIGKGQLRREEDLQKKPQSSRPSWAGVRIGF